VDKEVKYNRILIDLDSLLDVRQGVLSRLLKDDKALAQYVASDAYNFREVDDFSSIVDMPQYTALNSLRTKDIITRSTITYLFSVLKRKVLEIDKRNIAHNETKRLEILVNIYPFELTQEQQISLIDVLFIKLGTEVYIRTVYIDTKDITPAFMRDNVIIELFIYDTSRWLDHQLANVQASTFKLHNHRLNFPALYHTPLSEDLKLKLSKHGFKDVFSVLEYLTSAQMVINFLPVIFYNNIVTSQAILDAFNKKHATKSVKELFNVIEEEPT